MSDNKLNLVLEYEQDFLSMEMEDEGAMELSDQKEEQLADPLGPFICRDDLFSDSQLVELVNYPTQDPVSCPARDAETEKALHPSDFSLIEEVEA